MTAPVEPTRRSASSGAEHYQRYVEQATRAGGLLRAFNRARVIEVPDVQVAQRVSWLVRETDEAVQVAFALVVRALRLGSVCVTLATLREEVERSLEGDLPVDLPWPDPAGWPARVARSPLVTQGATAPGLLPLRLVDGQLYLERSWEQQEDVRESLLLRSGHGGGAAPFEIDEGRLAAVSGLLFDGAGLSAGEPDLQALAAHCAVRNRVTVLAGGPGTGKTTTIARLLALVSLYEGEVPRISLAAPSGKAAARLQEAVRTEVAGLTMLNPEMRTGLAQIRGVTVHRLLGAMPGRRVSRHAGNPLPSDVVVVDETSMVSLSQMAHLLAAVRPDARLVLVGDPDQLASVDAGAVLADVTSAVEDRGVAVPLVRLRRTWRYGGAIGAVAAAIRAGRATDVLDLLSSGDPAVEFVEMHGDGSLTASDAARLRHEVVTPAAEAVRAAMAGDSHGALAAMRRHRVLCAHRSGLQSKDEWNRQIAGWLATLIPGYGNEERYAGQPLLVTRNDNDLGISNGDTGIMVQTPSGLRAALDLGGEPLLLSPALLDSVETVHAMTVHKAQGSQFDAVTVVLPLVGSPLLTRELLYTAVTRASARVVLVAHPEALVAAVSRQALRASGLRTRL